MADAGAIKVWPTPEMRCLPARLRMFIAALKRLESDPADLRDLEGVPMRQGGQHRAEGDGGGHPWRRMAVQEAHRHAEGGGREASTGPDGGVGVHRHARDASTGPDGEREAHRHAEGGGRETSTGPGGGAGGHLGTASSMEVPWICFSLERLSRCPPTPRRDHPSPSATSQGRWLETALTAKQRDVISAIDSLYPSGYREDLNLWPLAVDNGWQICRPDANDPFAWHFDDGMTFYRMGRDAAGRPVKQVIWPTGYDWRMRSCRQDSHGDYCVPVEMPRVASRLAILLATTRAVESEPVNLRLRSMPDLHEMRLINQWTRSNDGYGRMFRIIPLPESWSDPSASPSAPISADEEGGPSSAPRERRPCYALVRHGCQVLDIGTDLAMLKRAADAPLFSQGSLYPYMRIEAMIASGCRVAGPEIFDLVQSMSRSGNATISFAEEFGLDSKKQPSLQDVPAVEIPDDARPGM